MASPRYSEEDQRRWAEAFATGGMMAAADLGCSAARNTLVAWVNKFGIHLDRDAIAEAESAHRKAHNQRLASERQDALRVRRLDLAETLLDDVLRIRERFFAPMVEHKVVVESQGAAHGSTARVVEIELPEPAPADLKALATSAAILIDKIAKITIEADVHRLADSLDPDAPAGQPVGKSEARSVVERALRLVGE